MKSVLAGAEPSSGAGSDSRSTLSSRGASLTNLEMTFRVRIAPLKHYEVTSDAVDELDEPVAVDRAAASRDEAAVPPDVLRDVLGEVALLLAPLRRAQQVHAPRALVRVVRRPQHAEPQRAVAEALCVCVCVRVCLSHVGVRE